MNIVFAIWFIFIIIVVLVATPSAREDGDRSTDCGEDAPVSYTIDVTLTPTSSIEVAEDSMERTIDKLRGILGEEEIRRVKSNLEKISERHGACDFFIVESIMHLGGFDFFENHPYLDIGDEVYIDVNGAYHYEKHSFFPYRFAKDDADMGNLFIYKEDPVCGLLRTAKIKGVYVGDKKIWTIGHDKKLFHPESHKLIVFCERTDNGGDDDVVMPMPDAGEIKDTFFCLNQMLRQMNRNLLVKNERKNH